jgi:hypothetical protein
LGGSFGSSKVRTNSKYIYISYLNEKFVEMQAFIRAETAAQEAKVEFDSAL